MTCLTSSAITRAHHPSKIQIMRVPRNLKSCINIQTLRDVGQLPVSFSMPSAIKLSLIAFTFYSIRSAFGALLVQSADDLPPGIDYDFIVAGGSV